MMILVSKSDLNREKKFIKPINSAQKFKKTNHH